jgi:cell division protein FtsQ
LIKECQVYKSNDKKINIDVVCREPVLKVYDKEGATYYVDIEGRKISDIKKPLLLPVASGEIDDSMINNELRNVVSVIEKDPFWIAQIEQIYFNDKREAIITPRMGDQIIELGSIKKLDEKLSNLKTFYTKALNSVGWDKYSKLNIKISNKVICTKRDK